MKKKNSISEFTTERSQSLLRNFRESIARQSVISAKRAFQDAADAPAPRFWVSEARAAVVISMMLRGEDPTPSMLPEKARMYREIYRRVAELRETEPDTPVGDLVFRVVNSPAPSSYMGWNHAKRLINSLRNAKR